MKPWVTLLHGDAREMLATLPAGSVHCCVTSPPYWNLRDYGVDGQIGLEKELSAYVAALVAVFGEVWRVLRDDGTLWLNLGDSFASNPAKGRSGEGKESAYLGGREETTQTRRPIPSGLKPKDLCGIPWRVAFALQAAGWYLRRDIIWAKGSAMPESVTDRPTSAHEYIFLLAKRDRYFYDADAIREPHAPESIARALKPWRGNGQRDYPAERDGRENPQPSSGGRAEGAPMNTCHPAGRNARSVWHLNPEPSKEQHFACVDEETEALTEQGWVRHDEIAPGMKIAAFSLSDQCLRWRPVEDVARYGVTDQEMVRAVGTSLDLLLTPNHRCVVQRKKLGGGLCAPFVKRADEMVYSDHTLTAAAWDEGGLHVETAWAELVGWYIAEGHAIRNSIAVEISQSLSANAPKVERIRDLLKQVGADYCEATAIRDWRGASRAQTWFRVNGYAAARLREFAPEKKPTTAMLLWNALALEALFAGLVGGDGHMRKDGRMSFIQKDKATADLVQALAVRLGRSAVLSQKATGMYTVYFTQHQRRSLRGTAGKGALLDREQYTGIVWCPKTPDGTWVARRNGRVFITGNTFPSEIPRRAILAGTSERGVCAACGAPWRREREVVKSWREDACEYEQAYGPGSGNRTVRPSCGGMSQSEYRTAGWAPSCSCAADLTPAVVLDPFCGTGTTLEVAVKHGRRAIGIDLNADYLEISRRRVKRAEGLFTGPVLEGKAPPPDPQGVLL